MVDETGITAKMRRLQERLKEITGIPSDKDVDMLKNLGPGLSKEQKKELKNLRNKYLPKTKTKIKKKDIDRTKEYMDFKSGKKDEGYKVMEAAKGGMVKGYKSGGPAMVLGGIGKRIEDSIKTIDLDTAPKKVLSGLAGRLAKRGYGKAK